MASAYFVKLLCVGFLAQRASRLCFQNKYNALDSGKSEQAPLITLCSRGKSKFLFWEVAISGCSESGSERMSVDMLVITAPV